MVRAVRSLICKSPVIRETGSTVDLRRALRRVAALTGALLLPAHPASAQNLPELRLCPPDVVDTCFIGYVTTISKIVVLLSSKDNDSLVGEEVEVDATLPGASVTTLDLSKQIGSIVMLDATGGDHIYSARIVSVADPLLTALYMSTFLQPPPDSNPPQ